MMFCTQVGAQLAFFRTSSKLVHASCKFDTSLLEFCFFSETFIVCMILFLHTNQTPTAFNSFADCLTTSLCPWFLVSNHLKKMNSGVSMRNFAGFVDLYPTDFLSYMTVVHCGSCQCACCLRACLFKQSSFPVQKPPQQTGRPMERPIQPMVRTLRLRLRLRPLRPQKQRTSLKESRTPKPRTRVKACARITAVFTENTSLSRKQVQDCRQKLCSRAHEWRLHMCGQRSHFTLVQRFRKRHRFNLYFSSKIGQIGVRPWCLYVYVAFTIQILYACMAVWWFLSCGSDTSNVNFEVHEKDCSCICLCLPSHPHFMHPFQT